MKTILSSLAALFCSVCFIVTGNPESFTPIDLSEAANMDFSDKTARDGKGGWFDDGENDLRFWNGDMPHRPSFAF